MKPDLSGGPWPKKKVLKWSAAAPNREGVWYGAKWQEAGFFHVQRYVGMDVPYLQRQPNEYWAGPYKRVRLDRVMPPEVRFVRMFKPRFAEAVAAGVKRQTVRPVPRRWPRPGDVIDCREWVGRPYGSPQRGLVLGRISRVSRVLIEERRAGCPDIQVAGVWLDAEAVEAFARADGFSCGTELAQWFGDEHGLPFAGVLIEWDPTQKGGADV